MRFLHASKLLVASLVGFGVLTSTAPIDSQSAADRKLCPNDDSELKLPPGFCASVFADEIGHARQLVVAPNGVVYVNTWSGAYYNNAPPHAGGFLVALQDTTGARKADVIERFGETVQTGGRGGTGIGLYKGSLYAEINDRIVRYALTAGEIVERLLYVDPATKKRCRGTDDIPFYQRQQRFVLRECGTIDPECVE